jgi:hypothetical protein
MTCGFSFVGIWEVETDAGPEPRAGKTREWISAADHVDRYAPTRNATIVDRTTFRVFRISVTRVCPFKSSMGRADCELTAAGLKEAQRFPNKSEDSDADDGDY